MNLRPLLQAKYTLTLLMLCMLTAELSAQPIKFVYFESFPPYSWVENNKPKGILIDIVNEVVKERLGVQVQHDGYPWARAQSLVESSESDAFITLPTPVRKKYASCSKSGVILIEMKIFVQKDSPLIPELMEIQSLNDLKKYDIVDYLGNGWIEQNLKPEDGWNVSLLVSSEQTYKMLNTGRAAIRMDVSHVGRYIVKKLNLTKNIIELSKPVVQPYHLNLCVGKKSKYLKLLPRFDEAFGQAKTDGTIDTIVNNYR